MFRHATLGQLGRIVLDDRPDGRSQVTCVIAGDPADPMTATRKALFEPVAMDLVKRLEAQMGSADVVWCPLSAGTSRSHHGLCGVRPLRHSGGLPRTLPAMYTFRSHKL